MGEVPIRSIPTLHYYEETLWQLIELIDKDSDAT